MSDDMDHSTDAPTPSPLDLLLSDPDRMRQIGSMVSSMLAGAPTDPVPPAAEGSDVPTSAPPPRVQNNTPLPSVSGTDGLASLLSNPTLLQNLPQILATVKPLMEKMSVGSREAHQGTRAPSPEECRNNLLIALKPFLSKERRQAVDSIIGLSRLSTVFQQLK